MVSAELAAAGLPSLPRLAWVEVDTEALIGNARALADAIGRRQLGVVVKADGYGHGLEVAARCAVMGGATWLCVATLAEALRLRRDGYQGRIFVLYPIPSTGVETARQHRIDVTVGGLDDLAAVAEAEGLAVHVEVDTGMTRGGVRYFEAAEVAEAVRKSRARLVGIWTHLTAPEDWLEIGRQLALFDRAVAEVGDVEVRHLAASGGILAAPEAGQELVRAGLIYYGCDPGVGSPMPEGVVPALEVRARPVRIESIPVGMGVGYGSTWRAQRPSRIATIPMGYADGWSRSLSSRSFGLARGRQVPQVGRISSDSMTFDVTEVDSFDSDSDVVLLGRSGDAVTSADDVAAWRHTISWEVLQQLGARLPRVYRHAGEVVAIRPESTHQVHYAPTSRLGYG